MPTIDIPINASVQELFDIPSCDVLRLPSVKPLKIELPSGGSMKALVDMSKGIPTDCSMSFNLLLQLQPLLVAIECPMRVLKLLKPLVDIITGLAKVPPEPPSPELIKDFVDAGIELVPCFTSLAAIPIFVKDVLCLIRAVLNCLVGQLRTVRDLLGGLQLRLAAAEGNDDQMALLKCAQENAEASLSGMVSAIDPIAGVLALLSPIMGIAGMDLSIELTPGAPPEDLEGLDTLISTLQAVVDAIDTMTGGACG